MQELPRKYDTPRHNANTSVGIALIFAGAAQAAYSVAMLAATFAGASLQIGGMLVQSLGQLGKTNADITVNEKHAAVVNATLNVGIFGSVLAFAMIISGVLALLHKRSTVWPSAFSAFLCLNLFVRHFAMAWFGFALIYVALGASLVTYAVYVFRQPLVPSVRDTQTNSSVEPAAPA